MSGRNSCVGRSLGRVYIFTEKNILTKNQTGTDSADSLVSPGAQGKKKENLGSVRSIADELEQKFSISTNTPQTIYTNEQRKLRDCARESKRIRKTNKRGTDVWTLTPNKKLWTEHFMNMAIGMLPAE